MKSVPFNFLPVIILLLLSSLSAFPQTADELDVEAAARNYIEGWYSADTARMAKALSEDLVKKGFLVNRRTSELQISPATYAQMLQWTGQKPDQMAKIPDMKLEVIVIEVGENIAMVKTIAPDFIDYLHLGKMDGEWKIYHAIWEPNKDK